MFFTTANNKSYNNNNKTMEALEVREERVYVGGKKVQKKGQKNKIVKVLNLSKVSHKL